MKPLLSNPSNKSINYNLLIILILALCIPAYLINLGMLRFIDDESIRALVALEMKISGDWITPTLGGEFYFKKPPVFNWILILAYSLSNHYSELTPRLTNLFFLTIYAVVIYLVVRKRYQHRTGFLAAILFVTSGRVLIYESLFGLIDMTYSLLIFSNFLLIYHYFDKKKYLLLYLFSYTITGVTFLFKGLPPIAMQGITLLVAAISFKQIKKLFGWQHFVGILPFFIITGSYYFAYWKVNPDYFPHLMSTLFHESADKSALNFSILESISSIFTYSFEVLYNFVPITLVVLFFLKKNPFELIKKDPYLQYLSRVFIFNIIIYLISPVTYMRYVLMLMPIISVLFAVHYKKHVKDKTWQIRVLHGLFIAVPIIFFAGMPAFPLVKATGFVSFPWIKAVSLMIFLVLVFWFMLRYRRYRIEGLVLTMLIIRLSFNFFILPSRVHNHWEIKSKEQVIKISSNTMDKKMYRYDNMIPLPLLYYSTAARMDLIRRKKDYNEAGYYMTRELPQFYTDSVLYQFNARPDSIVYVIEIKN